DRIAFYFFRHALKLGWNAASFNGVLPYPIQTEPLPKAACDPVTAYRTFCWRKERDFFEMVWGSGEGTDLVRIAWRLLHSGGRSFLLLPLRDLLRRGGLPH